MKLLWGWLLYLFDPRFRRMVDAKRGQRRDTVGTGERIIVVIRKRG